MFEPQRYSIRFDWTVVHAENRFSGNLSKGGDTFPPVFATTIFYKSCRS